jgi:4-hydroxyphenylpyruvate dioxygenase
MEIDHIHFYVRSADALADWLIDKMGLQILDDRSDPHTTTYLVGNAFLCFWISAPRTADSPVAAHLCHHPAGVKDIAFRVPQLDLLQERIDRCNGKILANADPADVEQWLRLQGWGAIEHTILQGDSTTPPSSPQLLMGIDHVVLNVDTNDLEAAVKWYHSLFDFQVQQNFQIQTAKSGLRSKALTSGPIRFNINEPISANSQIQEFLDANGGPGIQHIALYSNDILQTVDFMQQQGLAFLPVVSSYYEQLRRRSNGNLTVAEWEAIERLQILVDWSPESPKSLLMQTFTKPIFGEPTFFFEIIERRNQAEGFGAGNFQALFEAVERSST